MGYADETPERRTIELSILETKGNTRLCVFVFSTNGASDGSGIVILKARLTGFHNMNCYCNCVFHYCSPHNKAI